MTLQADIIRLLTTHRLPLADEKQLQAEIADVFTAAGLDFTREVRLSPRDIVDFMVFEMPLDPGIAVEIKIKGARRSIFRQIERYATHDAVGSIVLATNVAMNLPDTVGGKRAAVAALGRGWL